MIESKAELSAARKLVVAELTSGPFCPIGAGFQVQHVEVLASWRSKTIRVRWSDGPLVDEVEAVLATLHVPVEVIVEHLSCWSCGLFHQDREAAWLYHDGPSVEVLRDECHCCGRGDDYGVPDDVLDEERRLGFPSLGCRPGEFRRCARCGGTGHLVDLVAGASVRGCDVCGGHGVFDVSTSEGVRVWRSAQAVAVAAASKGPARR